MGIKVIDHIVYEAATETAVIHYSDKTVTIAKHSNLQKLLDWIWNYTLWTGYTARTIDGYTYIV